MKKAPIFLARGGTHKHQRAAAIHALLVWWMQRRCPYTPAQMEDYFHRMAGRVD